MLTGPQRTPESVFRARSFGMTVTDRLGLTQEEADELARREAMEPMNIECKMDSEEVSIRNEPSLTLVHCRH